MIKGVIFDIDGTLYDYDANDRIAREKIFEFVKDNLQVEEEKFREIYQEARRVVKEERLTDGGARHSRVLFFQTALELLGKNPFRYVLDMYNVYWDSFLANMNPFDGAAEFVRKLKDNEIKIAVCTDMTAHIQYRKIERLGLGDLIDFMVSSEETGLEKPSPSMFNLALRKVGIKPEEAAYFGDSLERDIEGAAGVGIKPFWFVGNRVVESTGSNYIKIRSYREVMDSKIFFCT